MRSSEAVLSRGGVAALACLAGAAVAGLPAAARAHEDHAPLPTKGVTIQGDQVLLSDKARKAIGMAAAKITFGDLHRVVAVNAKVELPWRQQAMITSLVPGKIERVMVRPGQTVAATCKAWSTTSRRRWPKKSTPCSGKDTPWKSVDSSRPNKRPIAGCWCWAASPWRESSCCCTSVCSRWPTGLGSSP